MGHQECQTLPQIHGNPKVSGTSQADYHSPYLHCTHSHPSWKGKKQWEGTDVNSSNPGQWVQAYLERDSRLPEWWEEFCPLVCSVDRGCDDAQVKSLACCQAAAFCLLETQKEAHSTWITPSCLSALGRREYLTQKDPRITQDYWEVWREEIVALVIVLQRCAICARSSPNVFCGVVQELCECLAPVVEVGDLFNMEKEIWEGVRKDPWLPCLWKGPLHQHPEWRNLPALLHLTIHLGLNSKGLCPLRNWPWCWEGGHHHPRFSPLGLDDTEMPPLEDVYRPRAMPMGTLLDPTALESLQMTISHIPVMGEVHYHLQA